MGKQYRPRRKRARRKRYKQRVNARIREQIEEKRSKSS